jgi:protein ImuB
MMQQENARRLAAVDDLAASLGSKPGQTVSDALALSPLLTLVDADLEADAASLEALADWCARFSPAVAADGADGLFMDIEGCAHFWGDEASMAQALIDRLQADNIPARIGIANTFGAAWALARYGHETISISHGDVHERLSSFPVSALRVEDSVRDSLWRLGLKTIGDLEQFPRGALSKRFGTGLLLQRDRAFGDQDEPLHFRYPPSPWIERLVFAEPISAPESIQQVCHDLLETLCARLNEEGLGARRFELSYHRVDGDAAHRAIQTTLPARQVKPLAKLFASKLETIDPGFGVEIVILRAAHVAPLKAEQAVLEGNSSRSDAIDLAPLIDRLRNELGSDRVWRATPFESHVPERAVARIAPLDQPMKRAWDPEKVRPIRLFARPQLINAIAQAPDSAPNVFTWRNQTHRIRRAEGPERIGAEWWRKAWAENSVDRVRDYYRIEDETGQRYWIFRAGLYGAKRPIRWYLHGLFA